MAATADLESQALPIGALAKVSGASIETIRYYERIGLLRRPLRTSGGRRVYNHGDIRALVFIRRARELGFSLDEIGALLSLGAPASAPCGEVREIAARHLAVIRAKLADLARLESVLATTIARCSGDATPTCPMLDILDIDRSERATA